MKIKNVEISHPEKVIYPLEGITKGDIAQYYSNISSKILPYLKNRAVSLVRNPAGIDQKGFYQKHPSESFPGYIDRVKIKEKSGETDLYITIDSTEDLVYLTNIGVLEYHFWLSKIEDLEHPDIFIFDLDPDPKADWGKVINAAFWIKQRVEKDGINPEVRVSGGKGLHIVGEYKDKLTWAESKAYTKGIAEELCLTDSAYLVDMSKEKREGKIFIDFYRNERGATAVAPYSLRARPGASICKPIEWSEVNLDLKPNQFKLRDFLK